MDRNFLGPDQTSAAKPFRFWLNNDFDGTGYSVGTEGDADGLQDTRDSEITSQRDLEDFARLWVSGMPPLPGGQGYSVTLSSTGPGFQLFPAFEADGGIGYLTDTTTAANQITSSSRLALGRIAPGTNYIFPDGYFASYGRKHFLFEGVSLGTGEVTLTVAQGTNVLAETSVFIDLQSAKNLYERVILTNSATVPISNWASGVHVVEYPVVLTDADESEEVVLYVHGASNKEGTWRLRSDAVFKRLYWAGFHGRFASVRWPSVIQPEYYWFNISELHAYKAASGFKDYLNQLQARFPNYGLHIVAHSQGGAIASETLSQGAPFDTLILSQVAMAASCYDVNAPTSGALLNLEAIMPTPDWQPMGYRGAHTNISGRVVNFYNKDDALLALWLTNQKLSKPSQFYLSDGTNGWYVIDPDINLLRIVSDSRESRAHVARARTLGIGAQGPTPGQNTQGIIEATVDLKGQFNISDTSAEHSAFFTRPIQTIRPFYRQLLLSSQIQPAP
jgi:pimeloyl-ACP methyl ester carboxylesterase